MHSVLRPNYRRARALALEIEAALSVEVLKEVAAALALATGGEDGR